MKKMPFELRVIKATNQILGLGEIEGERIRTQLVGCLLKCVVEHDDWCRVFIGKACNCNPDIEVTSDSGTYRVDHDGNAHLIVDGGRN